MSGPSGRSQSSGGSGVRSARRVHLAEKEGGAVRRPLFSLANYAKTQCFHGIRIMKGPFTKELSHAEQRRTSQASSA